MLKRIFILYFLFLIGPLTLFASQDKLIVTAEKANIYAEPYLTSYLIETIPHGSVLTLFQKGIIRDSWYYVRFQSKKYRGTTSGFIQAIHVEPFTGEVPPKKETLQPADLPPIPKPKAPEKKSEIITEEVPVNTMLPSSSSISLPQSPQLRRERLWLQTDKEFVVTATPQHKIIPLPPSQMTMQERIWLQTESGFVFTTTPAHLVLNLPTEEFELQERIWETRPVPKPEPEIEEPIAIKPVTKEPEIKKPIIEEPVTKLSLSDKIQLVQATESFEFELLFSPFSRFRHFEMTGPNRIVVDFYDVEGPQPTGRYNVNDFGIDAIRVGMFQENIARVVFDFVSEIPAYQIQATEVGLKILFWMGEAVLQKTPETKVEVTSTDTTLPRQTYLAPLKSQPQRQDRIWLQSDESLALTSIPAFQSLDLPTLLELNQALIWEIVETRPTPMPEKKPVVTDLPPPPAEPPKKDVEKKKAEEAEPEKTKEEQIQTKPTLTQPIVSTKEIGPLVLGFGVGTSQGGIGALIQYNTPWGWSLHIGGGFYPTSLVYSETDWVENEMLFSIGIKYYLPFGPEIFRPYLDLQYGGFSVEAVQVIVGIWEYEYIYENQQKVLYGPSLLAGGELKLGSIGLNAAFGFSYATTSWEWLSQSFYLSADFSLLYYF